MFIVVYGNVVEGYEFYGPFASAEAAKEWAESADFVCRNSYRVVKMSKPH